MKEDKKKIIAQEIGKRIYNIRKKNQLSREKFAEICNVSSQHIYYMEKGEFLPGCMTIIDICNNFDVSPTELLMDTIDLNGNILEEEIKTSFAKLKEGDKRVVIHLTKCIIEELINKEEGK